MKKPRNRSITVCEYQRIVVGDIIDGIEIKQYDIEQLKSYIDEENSKKNENEYAISPFLKPIRRGVQVNNYVGILQTCSGLTIEILPKIYGVYDRQEVRKIFFKMLKTVKNIEGKQFNMTSLSASKNNVLEVFISMFILESDKIIKRGLKSSYVTLDENERFLKGRLDIQKQLQQNNINKSKFYSVFDEFKSNIPENKLLKTTLELLLRLSKDNQNLRNIRKQLVFFDKVELTYAPLDTFHQINIGRNHAYYELALEWCRIFLTENSFTSTAGESMAFAMLFPMEKIFESYVAIKMKEVHTTYNICLQDRSYSLFDKTENSKGGYNLRPDIVVRCPEGDMIILDTKWKNLKENGPDQADLYQMYAYHTRYTDKKEKVKKVILVYPKSTAYEEQHFKSLKTDMEKEHVKIEIRFIDLFDKTFDDFKRLI